MTKYIAVLLIPREAGRYVDMLDSDYPFSTTLVQYEEDDDDEEEVDGEYWRNRVSQYKGKLGRTECSHIYLARLTSPILPSSIAFPHSIHH